MKKAWEDFYLDTQRKGIESKSGVGSSLGNTEEIREALPGIFTAYDILTMNDIPCGDWNWMSLVDLDGIDYLGCDIVESVIEENKARYSKEGIAFKVADITKDVLRKCDLFLCRDLFFHFSNGLIIKALQHIKKSARWLLTTSFPQITTNKDLQMLPNRVGWRAINLDLGPFHMPKPKEVIQEKSNTSCMGRIVGLYDMEKWV